MKFIFCFLFIVKILAHESTGTEVKTEPPESLYSVSIDRLDSFDKFDLSTLKGRPSLWVLFQPDCKSCEAQFRDLSCIDKSIKTLAVGFWGNRENLNKVVRFSKFKGTKLMATKDLEKLTPLKLTPTLLVVDQNGYAQNTFLGKVSCKDIQQKFNYLELKEKQKTI